MRTYKRINKRTGEEVVGPWHTICDLDVRVWTRAEEIVAFLDNCPITGEEVPYAMPLAAIMVATKPENPYEGWDLIWRDIYSHNDLTGLYIGG